MVKTKKFHILATSFLSGIAAIVSLISVGTEQWVIADGDYLDNGQVSSANQFNFQYGLFKGTARVTQGAEYTVVVTMTCLMDKNICALLCNKQNDGLTDLLEDIYSGTYTGLKTSDCEKVGKSLKALDFKKNLKATTGDGRFINAGVRIVTLVALFLSAILGLVAAGVAVWNTTSNPIEIYSSVTGLYIYNGVAFFFTLMYVMSWGIMFGVTLTNNVCVQDTLSGQVNTDGNATLGYSYWINLIPLLFYIASIAVLYYRQYMIAKIPEVNVHLENAADPNIYIY